jgi:hypothetical protein
MAAAAPVSGSAWWRWAIFAGSAAVAAFLGLRLAVGPGRSAPQRAAGMFVLVIAAAWAAGPGGAAVAAWAPSLAQWVQSIVKGGGGNGTQEAAGTQAQGAAQAPAAGGAAG